MHSTIVPCLRYADAPAAIAWLCENFGFVRHAIYPNPDGSIGHAELTLGAGMIMVSSVLDTPFARYRKEPAEVDQCETQTAYLVVADAETVYAKAKTAGAEILLDLKTADYGGSGFSCRDPFGHIWSIGTYDPWRQ